MIPNPLLLKLGAFSGAAAVALGAFGAHGLKNHVTDPNMLKNWDTAGKSIFCILHSQSALIHFFDFR